MTDIQRKKNTGEPTANGGHFGSHTRDAGTAVLTEPQARTYIERNVDSAGAALDRWPGTEGKAGLEKLTLALTDLTHWSAWAVKQRDLNTPGVNYQEKECDIINAWQTAIGHVRGDKEENYDEEPYHPSFVGSMAEEGTVELPKIGNRSALAPHRDAIHRAHERLARFNVRQRVSGVTETSLADGIADLMHWSEANNVDFGVAFRDALAAAESE